MQGGHATQLADVDALPQLPDPVKRVAMAMEVFHKASLVHDDIEDDDTYRYGRETLHRRYGVATAINVGDYLIGLGYRLVSRESRALGAEVVADILDRLAQAHQKLTEGQGAELAWRDAVDKGIGSLDALKIYALKTAPAFEVALYAGLRMAGPVDGQQELIAQFSRHLGVAFQIINDLKDWEGDDDNKRVRGQDVVSARPTLLLALALETATPEQKAELRHILGDKANSGRAVRRVRQIYTANKVFAKAEAMVQKFRDRAKAIAENAAPDALRELLCFLVDTVLDRDPVHMPEPGRAA
ncbi:MAG: polyprenyl synthetase family protein [Verrucomicrobiae bacterium]|nr:polyprenyl synthetase family protein [Verrucomicrobiae bacterium]